MRLLPETSNRYPVYILIYWIAIWGLLFLHSTIKILPNISTNGYVVRKDVCLEEAPTGRFDESTECIEYGEPYYVPVGKELIGNFKSFGIGSFIIVLIIGLLLMHGKRIEEKRPKDVT